MKLTLWKHVVLGGLLNGPPVQVEGGLSGGVAGSVLGVPDFELEGRKPGIGMGDSGT